MKLTILKTIDIHLAQPGFGQLNCSEIALRLQTKTQFPYSKESIQKQSMEDAFKNEQKVYKNRPFTPNQDKTGVSVKQQQLTPIKALVIEDYHHKNVQQSSKKVSVGQQEKLNQNLFIGSNPGLFCKHLQCSELEQQNQTKRQQNSLKNSQQQFHSLQQSQKHSINHIDPNIQMDQLLESQSSGYTIYDNETQHQGEGKHYKQTRILPFCLSSKEKTNRHTKHCHPQLIKQKAFIVPRSNQIRQKSKKSVKEYSPVNDRHLTNFFVTQNKKSYVKSIFQPNQEVFHASNVNQVWLQNEQNNKNKINCRQKQQQKPFNNRISVSSDPNFRHNFTNQYDYSMSNFERSNFLNTKFLIKVTPSDKIKQFFNLSTSTLINHNYRPLTSRLDNKSRQTSHKKQSQLTSHKTQSQLTSHKKFSQPTSRKNQSQLASCKKSSQQMSASMAIHQGSKFLKTFFGEQDKENKLKNEQDQKFPQRSCDYWAGVNSYKNINLNTKKGNKANYHNYKKSKNQNITHALLINMPTKPLKSFQECGNQNIFKQNKQSEETVQETVHYSSDHSKVHSRVKNENDQFLGGILKKHHIKRLIKLERQVMLKVGIVQKMGVKVPLLSSSNTKNIKKINNPVR